MYLDKKATTQVDFKAGILIAVDKPISWTSFDVVNKIRYCLKPIYKKIKVGHSGTLDPLASGLMIVATGRATKKIISLQGLDKAYCGKAILGATRPSYDMETEIDQHFSTEHISSKKLDAVSAQFNGEQLQTPPIFSALKQKGKKLYELARAGKKVEVKKRMINIKQFTIEKVTLPEFSFNLECSKGTYVRSLVHDVGIALDSGAYLSELRRTKIGKTHIKDAWQLDDLMIAIKERAIESL